MGGCGLLLLLPFALLAIGYVLQGENREEISRRLMNVGWIALTIVVVLFFLLFRWMKTEGLL